MVKYAPFSIIQEKLDSDFEGLHKRVISWLMFFASNKGEIEMHDGKTIKPCNIEFDGSIREIYWQNFIQPFLKESITNTFEKTREFANQYNIDTKAMLHEAYETLEIKIRDIFRHMIETDQKIRGKGSPTSVDRYNPKREIYQIISFLEIRYAAELAIMPKPKNKLELFYERQKFYIWAIPIITGIIIEIFPIFG
ncbi:MAG: hypothetical protein GY865_05140 [candidate division Zixibacteria bacterium]|nr:hypothetical protein [candidate division Zixibacteria bacterium]